MAVEDHPKFPAWSRAVDNLKAAKDHFEAAVKAGKGVEAARKDLEKAQKKYDQVTGELD